MREYDLIAEWYARERADETGVPELAALASSIPYRSCVLDAGCGNGIPITRALIRAGHRVVALDSSRAMLERLRAKCPEALALQGAVQNCPFADRSFDGFTLTDVHTDKGNHTYYLATRGE